MSLAKGLHGNLRLPIGELILDVELALSPSGITAIVGPSGSGKTTLLRSIAGLEPDAEGTLSFGASRWQTSHLRLPPHRRGIGFVFQQPSLFPHLSVAENLEYGRRRIATHNRRIGPKPVIEALALEHLLERNPARLSGGEKQRVALGRALLQSPSLLLLDEPFSAVDPKHRREIFEAFGQLQRTHSLPTILVSHSLDDVARLADDLIGMKEGRIVAQGPLLDVLPRLTQDLVLHDEEIGSIVEGSVTSTDQDDGLIEVAFSGGELLFPHRPLPTGTPLRVRVLARDVSLTLEKPQKTSILNVLSATVSALQAAQNGQVLVELDCRSTPLLARISDRSARRLRIEPGQQLWVQIKGVAIL